MPQSLEKPSFNGYFSIDFTLILFKVCVRNSSSLSLGTRPFVFGTVMAH